MNHMKQSFMRPLAALMALLMLISVIPVDAWATSAEPPVATTEDTTVPEGLEYEISGEEVTITGYTGTATELVVPETIEDYPVTVISNSAFADCTSLTYVKLPESVVTIGDFAFRNCTSLTSFNVPASTIALSCWSFFDCSNLSQLTVSPGNNTFMVIDDVLYSKDGSKLVLCPEGYRGSISIPNTVKSIGARAFGDCSHLTSIHIPDGVTHLGDDVFSGCTALKSVYLPNSITSIYSGLFHGCTSLETVDWPESMTYVSRAAFGGCTALVSVNLPITVTSIGPMAFSGCTALKTIHLPQNIDWIDQEAFARCAFLTEIEIPAGVSEISWSTFRDCDALKTIILSDSVKKILQGAFSGCDSLKDVYYGGTISQWNEVSIGDENEPILNARIHCLDGKVIGEHIYTAVVTDPTCEEQGYTTYTCSHCDDVFIDDYTDPLGHDWEGSTCTRCGAEAEVSFTDVPTDAFFYEPVIWAVEQGITNGYGSADTFAPDVTCNRGQVATFLWRAAGEPEPSSNVNPFTDIKESDYFYKAVLWAVEEGITAGYGSDTIFNPNGSCTRGQVATFLLRYFGQPQPASTENPFTDVKSSEFYYTAVLWAAESGITAGYGNAYTFAPNMACNRGQVVTFLYRTMN